MVPQQGLDLYNYLFVKMDLLGAFFNTATGVPDWFITLSSYEQFSLLIIVNIFVLLMVVSLVALGIQLLRVIISIFK